MATKNKELKDKYPKLDKAWNIRIKRNEQRDRENRNNHRHILHDPSNDFERT